MAPVARLVASALAGAALAAETGCGGGGADGLCASRPESEHLLVQLRKPQVATGKCTFVLQPETPYYWEPNCTVGAIGCWADGVHPECRFCDYGGVPCPETAWHPSPQTCRFHNEPEAAYYWEPRCPQIDGGLGCRADGHHDGCRFCGGEGIYRHIECRVEECTFANEPLIPYFFDKTCRMGDLGCLADGIHVGCRFCGARPYDKVPCPESAAVTEGSCWFRNEPLIPYFWDETCRMGMLGCWADGIHENCRFCSKHPERPGVYAGIQCE